MPTLATLGNTIQKSLPSWETTKTTSKAGFDKAWAALDVLGGPVNKLSHRLGSEAFWPTTLDKESEKAARILRSFCKDGFYGEEERAVDVPKGKQRVIKKIPTEVVKKAKGLAIFTTCRTGLWVSGAGGSGVLVARMPDGSWSPPSGILLHTAGLGFLVGVDIYDCVIVINSEKALQAFTKVRCTLGGEVSAVAGPVGVGGILESEIHKRQAPVWTYLKSRGFYAGVQVDGTIVIERKDENEKFYGERLPVQDILAGKVRHPPREIQGLMNTIKAAQGDTDVDEKLLPDAGPTPGDWEIEEVVDDDPFGVHALEKEGLEIHEAGTHRTPTEEEFAPRLTPRSPSSPSPSLKTPTGLKKPGPPLPPRNPVRSSSESQYPESETLEKSETSHDRSSNVSKAQMESDLEQGPLEAEKEIKADLPIRRATSEVEADGEVWKEAEEVLSTEPPVEPVKLMDNEKEHAVELSGPTAAPPTETSKFHSVEL